MAEEKKSIFRQKSLDRVSSPEEFDNYLQVTSPGIWMTLGAIVILLVGICIWGVFGRLSTSLDVAVVASGDKAICYVPAGQAGSMKENAKIRIADEEYGIENTGLAPEIVDGGMTDSMKLAGSLYDGAVVYPMVVDAQLDDGVYVGQIMVESIAPISFILN